MRPALAVLLAILLALPARPAAAQSSACGFALGFKAIVDQIPELVGRCLEDEHFNTANGNAEQRTTAHHGQGGLLVWRKADNWTAFTDGYWTWVNGPNGLQQRLNAERFSWEATEPPAAQVGPVDRIDFVRRRARDLGVGPFELLLLCEREAPPIEEGGKLYAPGRQPSSRSRQTLGLSMQPYSGVCFDGAPRPRPASSLSPLTRTEFLQVLAGALGVRPVDVLRYCSDKPAPVDEGGLLYRPGYEPSNENRKFFGLSVQPYYDVCY